MSWIRVRCELGHQQPIVFRPSQAGQGDNVTAARYDPSRPNGPVVVFSDYGDEDIRRYHHLLSLVPTRCGVCSTFLTHTLEEGDGPPGADAD